MRQWFQNSTHRLAGKPKVCLKLSKLCFIIIHDWELKDESSCSACMLVPVFSIRYISRKR